jgi:DNA topoisomerase-1
MKLVIVESPTKAKTISKFLGPSYHVLSSYGHVRDLPKSKLGIDVENNFEPAYVIPTKARKNVTALKKEVAKSDGVILATDEDREGEAIAWHLAQALKLDEAAAQENKKIERIVFHEITKSAIDDALKNPRAIDINLVDAQQARRVLDRIVGYQLSPFLWKKVAGGLSAGRVQSVTLRLIVDRENEIRNFKSEEYWTISAMMQEQGAPALPFEASLVKIGGTTLEKFAIPNKEKADLISADLASAKFSITEIESREMKKSPAPPFTTSTLQQEASKRLGFSSKKTMFLAQRLYENGRITYMRTDSVNLSAESVAAAKTWLTENLGTSYGSDAPRTFKAKSKLAQEAHEAVRPTQAAMTPDQISLTDEGEKKLYRLIWQRFMASQMPDARLTGTTIHIAADAEKKKYGLRATGQTIVFDGYLKIWPQKFEEKTLPSLTKESSIAPTEIKPLQHFTEPPPRYSEATLIKTLEEYGIGRPSTYAPTISTIQTRNYVVKEARKFKPTEIGELVNKVLTEHFPSIVDLRFTAEMEDELDEVANGKVSWQSAIGEFYGPFKKTLEEKYAEVSKEKLVPETTNVTCEKCGKPMVIKMSRFGKFMACSGFPDCRNTKKIEGGGGQEGPKAIGMKCPTCNEGDIVERRVSRGRARGKIFWGCSRYPKCTYATWTDPRNPEEKKEPASDQEKED